MATHRWTSPGKTRALPYQNQGFTLVELVTVMAIVAVLATAAAPSFSQAMARTRVKTAATDLLFALAEARSEAIKRNTAVTLSSQAGNWQNGWQILDPTNGANVLESHEALSSVASLTNLDGQPAVVYQSSGRITGSLTRFLVASATDTDIARCVSIDSSGRPYVAKKDPGQPYPANWTC